MQNLEGHFKLLSFSPKMEDMIRNKVYILFGKRFCAHIKAKNQKQNKHKTGIDASKFY